MTLHPLCSEDVQRPLTDPHPLPLSLTTDPDPNPNPTPNQARQTLLFSATFPRAIQNLAAAFLRPYVWIAVGRVGSTVGGITQRVWLAPPDKRLKLQLVVQALGARSGRTLVFVEKKRTATWLKKMLGRGGPEDAPEEERFPPIAAEVRSQ